MSSVGTLNSMMTAVSTMIGDTTGTHDVPKDQVDKNDQTKPILTDQQAANETAGQETRHIHAGYSQTPGGYPEQLPPQLSSNIARDAEDKKHAEGLSETGGDLNVKKAKSTVENTKDVSDKLPDSTVTSGINKVKGDLAKNNDPNFSTDSDKSREKQKKHKEHSDKGYQKEGSHSKDETHSRSQSKDEIHSRSQSKDETHSRSQSKDETHSKVHSKEKNHPRDTRGARDVNPKEDAYLNDKVEKSNDKGEKVRENELGDIVTESPDSDLIGNVSQADDEDSEYREIAKKLYNEDFVSIQPEEYTQFLAANDEESLRIRTYYMDCFKWDANLLQSTRKLCSKLYLKGESQEIDRILSSFTKSYLKQHPDNLFATRNFEKIYIIIYSLILLNTALHNSEVNRKKVISQTDYIKNTFTTFVQTTSKSAKKLSIKQKIVIERELSNYYEDLRDNELHLKNSESVDKLETSSAATKRLSRHMVKKDESDDDAHEATVDPLHENNTLLRQLSNNSLWSADSTSNTRRSSLAMKRMSLATLTVSTYTVNHQSARNKRGGFARALLSEQKHAQFYKNYNGSLVSNALASTARARSEASLLHEKPAHGLNKRSSRSSIVSKESQGVGNTTDDAMLVLSLDTVNLNCDDGGEKQHLEDFNVDDYQDRYDLTLELQGSPYLKEGLLKLKVHNNDQVDSAADTAPPTSGLRFFSFFSKSASGAGSRPNTTRDSSGAISLTKFVENFVVVSKGELSLYSFDPKVIKKHQAAVQKQRNKYLSSIAENEEVGLSAESDVGDGNWLKNAANVGNYNLCSTYASLEKPTVNAALNKKTILWSLTFPKILKKAPKKFYFEAGTKEIALEFINTCNFWAAKITAIPTLEESVSLIEYGWTNLDGLINKRDQFKKMKHVMRWESLPKGVYLSNYVVAPSLNDRANHEGMMKQFVKTLNYYNHLKKLYNDFTTLKLRFTNNLPAKQYSCANYTKVLGNYDLKIQEYKMDLTKYKNYLIILGFGLQLRFDLEDLDREAEGGAVYEDDELTTLVKAEIRKLFYNMKDISTIIPTFLTSKSINNISALLRETEKDLPHVPELQRSQYEHDQVDPAPTVIPEGDFENGSLVKSPKTFTLSHFSETESPINQLLQTTATSVPGKIGIEARDYSTSTIKEEEEPEE